MSKTDHNSARRVLIYLAPALMDMVLALFFFVNAVRLARMGVSASGVAGVVTMWAVTYLACCPLVGKILTVANSSRLMLASCGLTALLCGLHILLPSMPAIYVLMACSGGIASLFFPSFQVFMKAVDAAQDKTVAYSTGLYTFAWSMGFASGPFIAGLLMQHAPGGWRTAFVFAGVAALATVALVYLLKHLRRPTAAATTGTSSGAPAATAEIDYARMPDLAWLGWVSAGVGVLVLSLIRGVFPARAVSVLALSASVQGTIFFLLSLAQALTGLALCRSRLWMYRALPVAGFGLVGIAGCLCLGYAVSVPVLCAGALLVGLYSGGFYFYLVFHSLSHPSRSAQYISINESVVGLGAIAGPLIGGVLADRAGFGPAYLAGALLVLAVITVQAVAHRRHPPATGV